MSATYIIPPSKRPVNKYWNAWSFERIFLCLTCSIPVKKIYLFNKQCISYIFLHSVHVQDFLFSLLSVCSTNQLESEQATHLSNCVCKNSYIKKKKYFFSLIFLVQHFFEKFFLVLDV